MRRGKSDIEAAREDGWRLVRQTRVLSAASLSAIVGDHVVLSGYELPSRSVVSRA
jgi:hypothetical protein